MEQEFFFTVSTAQIESLVDAIKASRIAQDERRIERAANLLMRYDRFQRRWFPWLLLVLPLLGGGVSAYFSIPHFGLESGAILASLLIAYVCCWHWCANRLSDRISHRLTKHPRLERMRSRQHAWAQSLDCSIQHSLGGLEGRHVVRMAPEALVLMPPRHKAVTLPWHKIDRLQEVAEFYQLSTRLQTHSGLGYFIAHQSSEMAPEDYQTGLQYLRAQIRTGAKRHWQAAERSDSRAG